MLWQIMKSANNAMAMAAPAMSNLGVYLLANSELRTTNKRFTRSSFLTLSIRMHYERFGVIGHDLTYRIFTYRISKSSPIGPPSTLNYTAHAERGMLHLVYR